MLETHLVRTQAARDRKSSLADQSSIEFALDLARHEIAELAANALSDTPLDQVLLTHAERLLEQSRSIEGRRPPGSSRLLISPLLFGFIITDPDTHTSFEERVVTIRALQPASDLTVMFDRLAELGWRHIEVTGSAAFQRAVMAMATQRGVTAISFGALRTEPPAAFDREWLGTV